MEGIKYRYCQNYKSRLTTKRKCQDNAEEQTTSEVLNNSPALMSQLASINLLTKGDEKRSISNVNTFISLFSQA